MKEQLTRQRDDSKHTERILYNLKTSNNTLFYCRLTLESLTLLELFLCALLCFNLLHFRISHCSAVVASDNRQLVAVALQAHFSVSAHSETLHKQVCYDLSPKSCLVFITAVILHNPVYSAVHFEWV